jgi:hypothetical protein
MLLELPGKRGPTHRCKFQQITQANIVSKVRGEVPHHIRDRLLMRSFRRQCEGPY